MSSTVDTSKVQSIENQCAPIIVAQCRTIAPIIDASCAPIIVAQCRTCAPIIDASCAPIIVAKCNCAPIIDADVDSAEKDASISIDTFVKDYLNDSAKV